MNITTIFKKMQIFSLAIMISVATMKAVEPEHGDIAEMQKESQGTGKVVLEILSQASDAIQEKAVEAAGLVNSGIEKISDQLHKIQNSEFFEKAGKKFQKGIDTVKDGVKKALKKIPSIDLTETKKNVSDKVEQNIEAAKSVSKDFWLSCKNWWNNKSEYSSDELIIMGGAVVAVITIAGVTYVLYKNGTFKKIGDGVRAYPALTTLSAVTVSLLIALAHKMYTAQSNIVETK